MDLHFFFEGKLAREEVASAFFASLLDQRTDVRNELFDILAEDIGQELANSFKVRPWRVRVEVDGVDIRLDTNDGDRSWVILVENKLQSGSKQVGQLRRYYASQVGRDTESRVVAVYLAPHAVGESEVQIVKSSSLKQGDYALHISWDTISQSLRRLCSEGAETGKFLKSGIELIEKTIKDAENEKYPNVGEREEIHQIACKTREGLQQRYPGIRIGYPWRGKDYFLLGFSGTDITVWLKIAFEVEPVPPYKPRQLFEGSRMSLDVYSKLKLSGAARRKKGSKSRWEELLRRGAIDIPGVGTHNLQNTGWAVQRRKVMAPVDRMPNELIEIGALLLQWTTQF